jgi:hypothetical protein
MAGARRGSTRAEAAPGAGLAGCFTDYLASGCAPRQAVRLASALRADGYRLEAAVLSGNAGATVDVPGSPWNGRRLWTGTQLPSTAQAGDVWLDTCLLTPMLLVPYEDLESDEDSPSDLLERITPCIGWIDLRPVQRWQFAAFLRLARLTPREVQLDPPLQLLDPRRLLQGAEAEVEVEVELETEATAEVEVEVEVEMEKASVTNLTLDEARLCANWFGKAVCHLTAWQAARAFLPAAGMHALWGEPSREWAGVLDEGVHMVVSPKTIDADPYAEADAVTPPPLENRMLFGDWAHPPGVTFRTYVPTQLGLLTEVGYDGAWYLPLRLASRAPR